MTDRTHPDSGRIITSSDILLHDAETALMYEELRAAIDDGHESMTHADALAKIAAIRAENIELRAKHASIRAGGVQALSAAPRTPTVEQVEDEVSMGHGAWDMVDPQELIGAVLRLSVAASPTPPAEQQAATKAAPGEPSDAEIDAFLDSPGGIEWVIADKRERYRLLVRAALAKWAAPQQEAQEPSKAYAWVYVNKYGVDSIPASKDWCAAMVSGHGGSMFPLYTAHHSAPAPLNDDVVKDAALWHWLAEYLVGTRTDLDDEIVASKTVNDLRKLVEAAIKQGGKA